MRVLPLGTGGYGLRASGTLDPQARISQTVTSPWVLLAAAELRAPAADRLALAAAVAATRADSPSRYLGD
jgi:hypothetical protein